MKSGFEQGRIEFKQENYEKALDYFDNVCVDEEDYEFAIPYKISCLIKLECYHEALEIINPLIEEKPDEKLFWFDKVTCHVFLDEDEEAFNTLQIIEQSFDLDDKEGLVLLAKFYNMLNDNVKAIEYADKSLAIDNNYKEALFEKSFAAISLNDYEMIGEISDKLLEISNRDLLSLTPVFLLKLFSKNYHGCLDMINSSEELKGKTTELFKSVLYNKICEDLNVQLLLTQKIDLPVDDALGIMFDFADFDKSFGEICGVHYFIL